MKKSSLLFIVSTIMSLPIFGMKIEKEQGIDPTPQELCAPTDQGLFVVAQNIQYSPNKYKECTSHIPHTISLINKNLYKVFNDPITTRDIIMHSALLKNKPSSYIAYNLNFPGVKKCLALSQNLYNQQLTPDEIERLFSKGAIINYQSKYGIRPLSYWTKSDDQHSLMIIKKLISLGADPNGEPIWDNNSFFLAISKQNKDKLDALLNYYTLMHGKSTISEPVWGHILMLFYNNLGKFKKCPELIEHLITNVPKETCSIGLIACLDIKEALCKNQRTQLMKNFIAHKADTKPALEHLLTHIELQGTDYHISDFIGDFDTLSQAGAYSKKAITTLTELSKMFNCMAVTIDHNRPK